MICPFKKHLAVPNRDHVFHIQFPEVWTQTDVRNHFRKFGPVFIRWIDNTSAFVSLNDRENLNASLNNSFVMLKYSKKGHKNVISKFLL